MNIESDLKKDGIEVIFQIDTLVVNSIAKNVAQRIVESFPDLGLDESELFRKFARLNMYKANFPDGMAEASYYYQNKSIYFNEYIDYHDLEEFAIHECIHYIQERIDEFGKLQRMGLSNYTKSKVIGLSLNEAAVQYSASLVIGVEPDFEKYYDINLFTPSPSYYPLECALLNQILYFTGKTELFKSTFFSTDEFRDKVISLTSEDTYEKIQNNFDKLLDLEEKAIKISAKINNLSDGSTKYAGLTNKLDKSKKKIANMYFKIQNLIIEDFFGCDFNRISDLETLENFRHKLDDFSKIIGTAENYTFFDNYYTETMNKLEHKTNILENGGIETALAVESKKSFFPWIHKLFNLIFKKSIKDETNN